MILRDAFRNAPLSSVIEVLVYNGGKSTVIRFELGEPFCVLQTEWNRAKIKRLCVMSLHRDAFTFILYERRGIPNENF